MCIRDSCCSQFLDDFQPVSTKMAKVQSMSLNPSKISGACGRLMCCLRYEFEAYKDFKSRAPKKKTLIDTPVSYTHLARSGAEGPRAEAAGEAAAASTAPPPALVEAENLSLIHIYEDLSQTPAAQELESALQGRNVAYRLEGEPGQLRMIVLMPRAGE